MQAIPLLSLLLYLSLSLTPHLGARAAVLKSPRTAASRPTAPKVAHTCVEGDPTTTIRGIFSNSTITTTAGATATATADPTQGIADDDGVEVQSELPSHSLSAAAAGTEPEHAASATPLNLPPSSSSCNPHIPLPTAHIPPARLAAASPPPPTTPPPPPADADAERAFRAEYGDRYTQVTYWSCASAGVFAGRCGWHVPIIAVDDAAASGGVSSRGMVRVVVVVVVSGWLIWAV